MYLFFTIAIPILLILICINYWRRKKIIKKINAMCMCDKCTLLNELLEPFGYSYLPNHDIFTSRLDAWQRNFGYSALYDKAASRFNMIFDHVPIYFPYQGKTWLIEFWKGQYGINTGGEIGVYYADHIVPEEELENTHFQAVSDAELLRLSFSLLHKVEIRGQLSNKHWWLTCFNLGCFSKPQDLTMYATITFPTQEMTSAFVRGLLDYGYSLKDVKRHYNTISFTFDETTQHTGFFHKLRIRNAQWQNRFWCRVFLSITKPFCLSVDRVLYLYYYLPFAFRKTIRIRKGDYK